MIQNKSITPFVKWAGGKRQLIHAITKEMPRNIMDYTYTEPFLGGGAVLFHLQPHKAIVNDTNEELINAYNTVKENVEELITTLKKHENNAEYFYRIRNADRTDGYIKTDKIQRASRLIYLNKTCYNGLYRVNQKGAFNTPFGRYKNPYIADETTLRNVSAYLNENDVRITSLDYTEILKDITENHFVYLDPPYHPVSQSSSFTTYTKNKWTADDQIKLRNACDNLTKRNVKFLLSSSASDFIKELYENYNIISVEATRSINADPTKRGKVNELLVRNYK